MNMLARAITIASAVHQNQIDKGGNPYILHSLWVMNNVRHLGEEYMIVGVLHDVIEDSDFTIEDLQVEGFSVPVLIALDILTHKKENDTYDEYIQMISYNEIARAVKLKDLEHNSRITRLKGLRKKDFDRLEKYSKAYTYLSF